MNMRNGVELSPMPSEAANITSETPKRVRYSFDKIILRLNTRWGLGLPSIHGSQETALEQADTEHSLAKRCAGRIRYLCYRDCELDKVISDFEEDGRRMCSEWVWKPLQEEGTLPKMPVTKSFISSRPAVPREHRQTLLERLFVHLDEEFKLALESDVYRRTSFHAAHDAAGDAIDKAGQIRTSVSTPRTVTPTMSKQEASGITYEGIREANTQTRRHREPTKRKSSGSEKVGEKSAPNRFPYVGMS